MRNIALRRGFKMFFPGFTIGSAESSPSPAQWYILINNVDDVIETARFSLGIQPT